MELIRINARRLKIMLTPTDMSHFELNSDSIGEDFARLAFLISITVNHDDLEDAEECVIEFKEAIRSGDEDEIRLAKSRLVAAFIQLGRLCGVNIDSII